jgi:mRNA interferase MazF
MIIDIDATYRDGAIHPNTPLDLPNNTPVRVHVITIQDDLLSSVFPNETALLSEAALAQDWNRPEEDAAWAHLQSRT